jgi:hypothetical protein
MWLRLCMRMYAHYAHVYTLMHVFIFFFASLRIFFFLLFFFAYHTLKLKEKKRRFNRQNEMREIKMKERAYTEEKKRLTNK